MKNTEATVVFRRADKPDPKAAQLSHESLFDLFIDSQLANGEVCLY